MEFTLFGKSFRAFGGKNQVAVSNDGEIYVQSERRKQLNPAFRPFLHPTFGAAMNQNVTFGGAQEIIHNGGTSTEWDAAIGAGTWDFSTGGVVTLTAGNNADFAVFSEETPTTIDISNFIVLTGVINLTTYTDLNHSLLVTFDLAGVVQGNSVVIDDYIDTSLLGTAQNFAIPLTDMGLAAQSVDGFTITLVRAGGSKPTMTFDDITLEATGTPAAFTVAPIDETEEIHISGFRITMVDDILTTAIAWDKLMGLTKLPNGIVFRRVQDGITNFAVPFKQFADFSAAGSDIANLVSDGTDTLITFQITFSAPIILTGAPENNFLTFTVNDDLSSLLLLTASARGGIVTNKSGEGA